MFHRHPHIRYSVVIQPSADVVLQILHYDADVSALTAGSQFSELVLDPLYGLWMDSNVYTVRSPLRGSLRAVSGSIIIILAVIAYMRSCLMVCDGILAPPSVTQWAGGSWRTSQAAITRTDVSVLAYSIVNVQQRFPKRSLYYI